MGGKHAIGRHALPPTFFGPSLRTHRRRDPPKDQRATPPVAAQATEAPHL